MPVGDKFRDEAVRATLYEYQEAGDVGQMLNQSPTNSRVNEDMARVCIVLDDVSAHWCGGWHNLFGDVTTALQRHYLNMEGFARVQAVEMCGAHTMSERFLEEKKVTGGLLGLFKKGN